MNLELAIEACIARPSEDFAEVLFSKGRHQLPQFQYGNSFHNSGFQRRAYLCGSCLELDVSSCGGTKERALKNLKDAVRLFLEEAEKMGSLKQILREA